MLEIATGKEIFIIKLFECNMNLTTKINEIILLTLLMQKKIVHSRPKNYTKLHKRKRMENIEMYSDLQKVKLLKPIQNCKYIMKQYSYNILYHRK